MLLFAWQREEILGIAATLGYYGFYHDWLAMGGSHDYPEAYGGSGDFAADEKIIGYQMLYHLPYIGFQVWYIGTGSRYLNVKLGLSYFPFINDRDNHYKTNTIYDNSYSLGFAMTATLRYIRPLTPVLGLELGLGGNYQAALNDRQTKIHKGGVAVSADTRPQLELSHFNFYLGLVWNVNPTIFAPMNK